MEQSAIGYVVMQATADGRADATVVHVTDLKLVPRGQGLVGSPIELPTGRYLASATLPDGRTLTSDEVIVVTAGDTTTARFGDDAPTMRQPMSDDPIQPPSRPARMRVSEVAPSGLPYRVLIGPWLQQCGHLLRGRGDEALRWQERTMYSVDVTDSRDTPFDAARPDDVLIGPRTENRQILCAVPVNENGRPVSISFDIGADGQQKVSADLNSKRANELFQHILDKRVTDARVISAGVIQQAERYLQSKDSDPLLAAMSIYVLLRANELEGLAFWVERLVGVAPWMPDVRILYAETMARYGRHRQAIDVLAQTPDVRMPWFRSGVGYLEQRLQLYTKLAEEDAESVGLADESKVKLTAILDAVDNVSWSLDLAQPLCTYRGLPLLPAAKEVPHAPARS